MGASLRSLGHLEFELPDLVGSSWHEQLAPSVEMQVRARLEYMDRAKTARPRQQPPTAGGTDLLGT